MICRIDNIVFYVKVSNKLSVRNAYAFLGFFTGSETDYIMKYKSTYPNDSIRTYKVGQSIPNNIYHNIIDSDEFKNAQIIYNRESSINGLLFD